MQIDFSLKRLRSFCAVAQYGGFGAAAEALGLSQPTLSSHIAHLEEELRTTLVWRTTRKVRLTPSGKRFLVHAQRALDALQNAALELRDQAEMERGRVVLACMPTLTHSVIPPAISAFCASYPGISVDLVDQPSRQVENSVLNGEADLGIGSKPEWTSTLAFERLAVDKFVAILRSGSHPGKTRTLKLTDLDGKRLITLRPSPSIRRSVEKAFADAGLPFQPRYQVTSLTTALGLVEAGLGIALLPETAIPRALSARLSVFQVKPQILRSVGIIKRRGEPLSPPAAQLLNFVRQELRKLGTARQ